MSTELSFIRSNLNVLCNIVNKTALRNTPFYDIYRRVLKFSVINCGKRSVKIGLLLIARAEFEFAPVLPVNSINTAFLGEGEPLKIRKHTLFLFQICV
jgi:hypothetical protein